MSLRSYNRFLDGILPKAGLYDFTEKEENVSNTLCDMLNRTSSMFRWTGLPDTIPQRILELFLQINGNVCFYEHENNLYVFTGGLGGEPDVYYEPTIYTIANPALKISKSLKIGEECVLMFNDTMRIGMMPLFIKRATQLCETELSLDIASINSRIIDLIDAQDDNTRESALKYLEDVREGKPGVIASNAFLEGIHAQPYGNTGTNNITNLIELYQYYRASWYNDIGLSANYNMKRESLNSGESTMDNDILLPLVDDMLARRREAVEKVNAMYGTNISVDLNSSWEDNEEVEETEVVEEQEEAPADIDEETEVETDAEENS